MPPPKRRVASLSPPFAKKKRGGEEMVSDPGNNSDHRRVQIDRKPSCQPPPTPRKAGNNCAHTQRLKRLPAADSGADGEALQPLHDFNSV